MAQAQHVVSSKPISIARFVSSIPEGQPWGGIKESFGITTLVHLAWDVGAGRINVQGFAQPARNELKKEGFTVVGDLTDPFEAETHADLALGAVITGLNGQFIQGLGMRDAVKGSASLNVKWEIYSNNEKRVIATIATKGSAKTDSASAGAISSVLISALTENVRTLTASAEFKSVMTADVEKNVTSRVPSEGPSIALLGASAAKPMPISDTIGSVVMILSGGGHGSGFLVSSDGYVMTAQHVVGTDKYVKVRWSDGIEGVGEVVRSDRRRDVALVRVDPRGRQPLALHRAAPQPGDTVFAVGAPLDEKFQSTVTRGVASANRIQDGFSFIQSDVTINPGNSGGPLLDEKGEVLGICDLTYRETPDAPTGINYFVPIADALLFLKAEPR